MPFIRESIRYNWVRYFVVKGGITLKWCIGIKWPIWPLPDYFVRTPWLRSTIRKFRCWNFVRRNFIRHNLAVSLIWVNVNWNKAFLDLEDKKKLNYYFLKFGLEFIFKTRFTKLAIAVRQHFLKNGKLKNANSNSVLFRFMQNVRRLF